MADFNFQSPNMQDVIFAISYFRRAPFVFNKNIYPTYNCYECDIVMLCFVPLQWDLLD